MHPGFRLTGIETHPLREQLNDEFHSRAPIPLTCPMLVSHLAFHHDSVFSAEEERENVLRLCQTSACTFIENSPTHLVFDAGGFMMRWELHTEYSSYTFLRPLREGEPLQPDATAMDAVFPDWVSSIPGRLIVATHVELRSAADASPSPCWRRCRRPTGDRWSSLASQTAPLGYLPISCSTTVSRASC